MAMYARNNEPHQQSAADEPEQPKHSEPEEHKKVDESSVKQLSNATNPIDIINNLLTALNLPVITVINPAAVNTTAIAQGLVLATQQIATNIVNQNNQANLAGLALFNNVTSSLLNLPSILRFPSFTQPQQQQQQQASSDEAHQHQPGFKKIPVDSPAEQEQEKVQKPDKPVFFLPRRPEFYYPPQPYPYYGPYHPYQQPFYHYPAAPYHYPGRYGPSSQFRRPASGPSNPTSDESLSDLEALAQLEELLSKSSDEEGYYREAEARGLLSSLSTGASSVRAGFKNIYNSISAALPSIVYKTLVVPSLASGSSSSSNP